MNIAAETIRKIMEIAILDGKNLSVEDLNKIIGYSRPHWTINFKSETGITANNYMRYFRLRCVCHDLRTTNMNFADIAAKYDRSLAYLARDFHKIVDITPGEYRMVKPDIARLIARDILEVFGFLHDFSSHPPQIK